MQEVSLRATSQRARSNPPAGREVASGAEFILSRSPERSEGTAKDALAMTCCFGRRVYPEQREGRPRKDRQSSYADFVLALRSWRLGVSLCPDDA